MTTRIKRIHSEKIRSLFKINPTGVDIVIEKGKRVIKIEVKEAGRAASFVIKPKDMETQYFLFYDRYFNLYMLVRRTAMKKIALGVQATRISFSQVRTIAFFQTTNEQELLNRIKKL